jgi:ISXO2-like transposase domain/Transposase zinc-ribbon domain
MMGLDGPVGGRHYPRTFQEFRAWFPDDAACIDYLGQLRWPDGFVCPKCGCDRSWRTAKRQWVCARCAQRTSVTAGTIFHRSHTPLSTWFAAAWFVTSQKNGVSAVGLQHALGFGSYETAWAWMHKLRRAMVRPDRELLAGEVELDQIFIGGRSTGNPGGASDKVPVIVAVERGAHGTLGRVRFGLAERSNSQEMLDFACTTIAPGSTIHTDGLYLLRRLADLGYRHEFVVGARAADLDTVMPGVHLVSSLVKRWIAGTLQHNVSRDQLAYYLDEYAFRFNRRRSSARGMLFYRLLQQAVATDPHPLNELYSSR